MATERKRGARKQTGKTARSGGKRRARKPKVRLSARKVYVLSGLIVLLCAASLSMSVVMSARAEGANRVSVPAQTAQGETRSPAVVPQTQDAATYRQSSGRQAGAGQASSAEGEWITPSVRQQDARQQSVSAGAPKQDVPPQASPAQRQNPVTQSAAAQRSAEAQQQVAMARPRDGEHTARRPSKPSFDIPPAKNGATLVFVIDDAGRSAENVRKYVALPFPLTVAVLPRLPQSRACADVVREAGKEAILHQPMQAMNLRLNPGAGAVTATMGGAEIAAVIRENLAELGPGIVGLNNHEGSLITADLVRIGTVLDVCAERGIYFLDSRTTAETKAPQAARERGMAIFEKAGPYIDNDIDRDKMLARLYETLAYANAHGVAIVIGHVDKSVAILPALLAELYPHLAAQGYRFATPSMLR